MKKHYRKENNCLNCGTILEGKFCHHCGQENLQIKESFGHMMTHAIADYFHFDHQFFHTLRPLLLKPGKLTNEYMAGRRVQYLHPVKMYIFISIVYFLLLFSGGHEAAKTANVTSDKLTKEEADSLKNVVGNIPILTNAQKDAIKEKVDNKIDTSKKFSDQVKELHAVEADTIIKGKDTTINKKVNLMSDEEAQNDVLDMMDNGSTTKRYKTYEEYLAAQEKLPEAQRDGFVERYLRKKQIAWRADGKEGKKAVIEGIKHNIPKMMFVLLPLFALILKITFYKNKKFYVEHLIFSFHFHCFLFLFLAIIMIISRVIPGDWDEDWLNMFAFVVIVWYIYRSLRVVYDRSRLRTITKMIGMWFSYFFTFIIAMCLLFVITALTAI
jgi:hypothetical protein